MAKIVIDGRELRTTSGRYVFKLIEYLQKLDHKNDYLILIKPKDDDWQPISPNFKKVICPYKEFSWSEQLILNRQLKSLKADLIHFAFPQQPILYKGKTITTIHDLTTLRFINPSKNKVVYKIKQRIYKFVIKKATDKASAVITPSNFVKDDITKSLSINSAKITVTYEAADKIKEDAQPIASLINTPFIVYVGRPMPHKNLKRLILAFEIIKKFNPELKLVLAGKKDVNYQLLEKWVNKKSINQVVFSGFVSEAELKWLYQNCRAYVFPSLSEGFGLPGLEAMVHGAPVVAARSSCLTEIYGQAAEYFDPMSVNSIAKAINQVISSPSRRLELISLGQKQAGQYSWLKMAEQTLNLYQKLLNKS